MIKFESAAQSSFTRSRLGEAVMEAGLAAGAVALEDSEAHVRVQRIHPSLRSNMKGFGNMFK